MEVSDTVVDDLVRVLVVGFWQCASVKGGSCHIGRMTMSNRKQRGSGEYRWGFRWARSAEGERRSPVSRFQAAPGGLLHGRCHIVLERLREHGACRISTVAGLLFPRLNEFGPF